MKLLSNDMNYSSVSQNQNVVDLDVFNILMLYTDLNYLILCESIEFVDLYGYLNKARVDKRKFMKTFKNLHQFDYPNNLHPHFWKLAICTFKQNSKA